MSPLHNRKKDLKGRREFVISVLRAASLGVLATPVAAVAEKAYIKQTELAVQQVIDLILKSIPDAPFKQTVDTIKVGDGNQKVTGIVTTMFATDEVIAKAAKLGANFIIAHEPTFYNHADETSRFENDDVYRFKRDLLDKHKIAVWRFHDYIHAHRPDGVTMGVLQAVGWEKYYNADKPHVVKIPAETLENLIGLVKKKLGIHHIRFIGDRSAKCSKIVLAPGAAGGAMQITALQKEKPDLMICGELNEWETSEYVRDLRFMGGKTSLIVLGHIVSEEPGLEWLVKWLQPQIPLIKITHIPSTDAFSWA